MTASSKPPFAGEVRRVRLGDVCEVEKAVEKAPELLGFHDVLKTEADDAIKGCYDLSIVAVKERDGLTEDGVEAARDAAR